MKLRTALAGAVGSGAGLAVANRVLAGRARDFDPLLRGDRGTYRWRGFDLAYTEAGDPADPDLLLLHGIGIAAAGHEWAGVFDRLARDYHVVAPDLPGFGHSDRPPLLYSASTYETAVADAVADLFADPPVIVASSLTGAYAAAAARAGRVGELVLATPRAETTWTRSVARRTLLRTPLVGQALFNVLASKPAIRHVHTPRRYADPARLTDRVLDYEWTTAHQQGARYAPASLYAGFLDSSVDLGAVLAALDVPVTLVWGREATDPPLSTGRDLAERADARLVVFDDARRLPHVEHPEAFADLLCEDVAATAAL